MRHGAMLLILGLTLVCGMWPLKALAEEQLVDAEQQAMADTLQYALENNPTNQPSDWVNPDSARSGAVVPTRTFKNVQGEDCREFLTTIIIAGKEEQGYGTACRQADGSWQLRSDDEPAATPPPAVTSSYFVTPPPVYYSYPSGFFGLNHIYLSFGYVYRSGNRHSGRRYLDGWDFRARYPIQVRERLYIGPRIFKRSRLHDEWDYREWERHQHQKPYGEREHERQRKGEHSRKRHEKRDRDHR